MEKEEDNKVTKCTKVVAARCYSSSSSCSSLLLLGIRHILLYRPHHRFILCVLPRLIALHLSLPTSMFKFLGRVAQCLFY